MKKVILAAIVVVMALTGVFAMVGCNKDSDWAYIEKNGEMIIGYTLFAPIAYEEGGELIGFDIDLAKAVAADLGINVKFQLINWDTKEVELNAKNIDLIWNGMTITEDRQASMQCSIPYLNNRQVAVIRKADADKYTTKASMASASFVAEKGSAGADIVAAEFANSKYTALSSQADALNDVKAGTSDIVIIDSVMAGFYCSQPDYADLQMVTSVGFATEQYGIAGRKGDTEFIGKINASLKKLNANGTVATIAAKYGLESEVAIVD